MATTGDGRAQIEIAGRLYQESIENVTADATPVVSLTRDVSALSVFSFAVHNTGLVSAFVRLDISPDGSSWKTDTPEKEISPGSLEVMTPTYFLRFNRLVCRAASPTPLRIWFQAQS